MQATLAHLSRSETNTNTHTHTKPNPPPSSTPIPAVPGAVLIHNALTPSECASLRQAVQSLHTSLPTSSSLPRRGSQHHIAANLPSTLLTWLSTRLTAHLPARAAGTCRAPHHQALSGFLRTYCYQRGDFSAPHWDRCYRTPNLFSAFSVLLYLNDDFHGGETTFFHADGVEPSARGMTPRNARRSLKVAARVKPREGSVLVFPHGKGEGLLPDPLHEGSPVRSGCKMIIRTDLMFVQSGSGNGNGNGSGVKREVEVKSEAVLGIERLLEAAVRQVCRDAWDEAGMNMDVRCSPNVDYELECSCVERLFWWAFRRQRVEEKAQERQRGREQSGPVVAVESDYGVRRSVSRSELAALVVEAIPRNRWLAFVAVSKGGSAKIYMISAAFAQTRLAAGLVCCGMCGKFVDRENGLEWHLRTAHRLADHNAVYARKEAAQLALSTHVDGSPSGTNRVRPQDLSMSIKDPSVLPSMVAAGKVKALPPGLEQCRSGDLDELKRLVANSKYDPTKDLDHNGANGLLWAAGFGHLAICKYLVQDLGLCVRESIQRSKQGGYDGRTALHWAARNGHMHVLQWLLDVQAVPADLPTSDGTTAFHLAVWQGQMEACKLLLARGANPHLKNKYGCASAHWCCQSAASKRSLVLCKWLKELEVDFTTLNENGQGCLHKAAQRGNTACCKWLMTEAALGPVHFRPNYAESSTPSQLAKFAGFNDLSALLKRQEDAVTAGCASGSAGSANANTVQH